ncbi:hypothetical protein Leryth_017553 [Lithospermum erythrorhizon]|nr:hypothetical protein Leryth_017553 [Lithospermum erythrorhizon]
MSTSEQLCREFSLDEVNEATRNFDEELIIGKGGFGVVYIGSINNAAEVVAMKRLSYESRQGETEFLREIETLSKLQHDHLVRLKGYCNESPEMILVYEYMPSGTLADHIGDNQTSCLTWEQRRCICIGAARGLDFLHTEYVPGIIHRDVKDSNILLDFGLAKLVKFSSSELQTTVVSSTGVKGTFGYLDPEYFYTQRLSKKTDVYAFGVVLLVVLCGRPTMEEVVAGLELALKKQLPTCHIRGQPNVRANMTQMMMAKLQLVLKKQPGM